MHFFICSVCKGFRTSEYHLDYIYYYKSKYECCILCIQKLKTELKINDQNIVISYFPIYQFIQINFDDANLKLSKDNFLPQKKSSAFYSDDNNDAFSWD